MEQDEVIRRLKGLGRTETPAAPDFTAPLAPVSGGSRARFGIGSIAAVVGVLALGTAAMAVPDNGPLRQVVAGLSTEVETDLAEVEAEVDVDESGVTGSVGATPCDGPPPTGTPADNAAADLTDDGLTGGATVEVDPEDREAQVEAWQEWREANCGPDAVTDGDRDDSDKSDDKKDDAEDDKGQGHGRGGNAGTHPHEDDPCKGPPPHSNKPESGDPERDEAQRNAEREAWKQWHHENCPPGQTNDHPGHEDGHGRPDDAGKPDDTGKPEQENSGKPDDAGRPDGAGKPEGTPDHDEDDDS